MSDIEAARARVDAARIELNIAQRELYDAEAKACRFQPGDTVWTLVNVDGVNQWIRCKFDRLDPVDMDAGHALWTDDENVTRAITTDLRWLRATPPDAPPT